MSLQQLEVRKKRPNLFFAIKAVVVCFFLLSTAFYAYFKQNISNNSSLITYPTLTNSLSDILSSINNSTSNNTNATPCTIASIPWPDRCAFANNNPNCNYYTALQYCQFYSLQPLWYILAIPYVIILLYSLGNIADSYFVPPLVKLSKLLHMPNSLAGVTLLALGNGAPDISTILVGVFTGKVAFALGDPIGGGLFDGSIVMGAISFAGKGTVRVSQLPFIRDVVFYLISVSYVFYIFLDNRVTIYEGIICLVLYGIYVFIVIFGRIINVNVIQKYKKRKQKAVDLEKDLTAVDNTSKASSPPSEDIELQSANTEKTKDVTPSSPEVVTIEASTIGQTSIANAVIKYDQKIKDEEEEEDWTSGYTIKRLASLTRTSIDWLKPQIELKKSNETYQIGDTDAPQDINTTKEVVPDDIPKSPRAPDEPVALEQLSSNISRVAFEISSTEKSSQPAEAQPEVTANETKEEKELPKSFIHRLWDKFLKSIEWKERKWYEKVFFVVIQWLPHIIFSFTIPRVEEKEWNRLYIICVPMFAPLVFLYATGSQYFIYMIAGVFPVAVVLFLSGALVSLLLLILLWRFPDKPPKWFTPILMICAFAICVVWLYIIANEVQNMLQSLGEAWGIAEAILGVTVLAWGNSIGDFAANVAVTRQGYGSMGVGACYGGPMLNLLLGLGVGFTFNPTQLREFCYPIAGDPVVSFSFMFLIVISLLSLIIISICRFRVRRPYGVFLICIYIVYLIMAILATAIPVINKALTWTFGRGC